MPTTKQPKLPKSFPAKGWRRVRFGATIKQYDAWDTKCHLDGPYFVVSCIGQKLDDKHPLYRKIKSKKGKKK